MEHEQYHGSSHHKEDLKVKSLQRTVSMMRRTTEQVTDVSCGNYRPRWDRPVPLKLGTPKTVEDVHNTADTKYSVSPVAKIAVRQKRKRVHRSWSIFRERNRFAFTWTRWIATLQAASKKSSMRSRTRWRVGENTHNPQKIWWKWYECLRMVTTGNLNSASSRAEV